jgi:hypothetical protein
MVIEIAKDECLCDEDDIQDYVDVLNGIVYECVHGNFKEGYRNQVAVDLTVAAYMLGLDAELVLHQLIVERVINPLDDDEDIKRRVETVLDYRRRFDWEYMIEPETFIKAANDWSSEPPVKFRIY